MACWLVLRRLMLRRRLLLRRMVLLRRLVLRRMVLLGAVGAEPGAVVADPQSITPSIHTTAVTKRTLQHYNKTSTTINKTNNKRIPVPDPDVPALPEMTTSTSFPYVGPTIWTDFFKFLYPSYSLPPYINKLTGHFKFRYRTQRISKRLINRHNELGTECSGFCCGTTLAKGPRNDTTKIFPRGTVG
ncbi:hypothetical protein ACLKA6_008111 [Drosophila palustris]